MNIRNNIDTVTENIKRACESSGRSDDSVKLIAVSKTKPLSDIYKASQAGITDFGENYVQEILEKYPLMPEGTRIHMIGASQTNKVKKVIDKVCMIHSVDSVRLAEVISEETQKRGITMDILLEVNIADEPSKYGFALRSSSLSPSDAGHRVRPGRVRGARRGAPRACGRSARPTDQVPRRGMARGMGFNRTTSDALYACASGGALLAFPDDGAARDGPRATTLPARSSS